MKILKRIFIDGLSGMAIGLFATLIIGTILEQAGTIIGGDIGNMIVMVASIAKVLTGAGIGIGVASKLGESTLVCASAASAGMIGAFASGLLNGSVSSSGKILLSGPGEPLGAFVAAYIGIEIGRIFIGRTKLDIILTPLTTIVCGGIVGLTVGPYISDLMKQIGEMIRWGTEQQPFLMGIVVSVLMGMASSDQFSSTWNYFESFWNCRRSSNDWVLCTDDRICDGQFTGEWNWRSIGTGNRNIDVTGSQYCKKTIDLAATDHYKCHSWSDLYCSFKNDE